jgi:flagellum-specific peptidoglycan hydrolase FlgJ
MAQSMIETGKWKSNIFKENHNLFGMKEAKQRVTTAGGTQNNHAFYQSWRESVYDYAFYQCRYLATINTEAEYYQYLSNSYASDKRYVEVLKKTIETNNLKQYFN